MFKGVTAGERAVLGLMSNACTAVLRKVFSKDDKAFVMEIPLEKGAVKIFFTR